MTAALQSYLKTSLGLGTLQPIGGGSGCISAGTAYATDGGKKIFVKMNNKDEAKRMFVGEEASLNALADTKAVIVPKPIQLIDELPGGGCCLVMDYLELSALRDEAALGTALAKVHMHNWNLLDDPDGTVTQVGVTRFGFDVETCCGYLPQKNAWRDDWVEFYSEKIDHQIDMLGSKDKEASTLWSKLRPRLGGLLFNDLVIRPSLLHGDLWSGNAGQTPEGVAIFDAASFYGHHEYDFGIATMFGGYGRRFNDAYFSLIPKQPEFDKRVELYQLFHYLNHWNHFGGGYRSSSIRIMKDLLKI